MSAESVVVVFRTSDPEILTWAAEPPAAEIGPQWERVKLSQWYAEKGL